VSHAIEDALREIEAPTASIDGGKADEGTDIVSAGLVGEITVDDGMANVPLAFGAPYSPAETELAAAVRAAVEEAGYESVLSIEINDDTPAADDDAPIVIAVSSGKGGVGKSTRLLPKTVNQRYLSRNWDIDLCKNYCIRITL